MEPHELTARAAAALVAAGTLSALDLARSCLARIALREDEVHAFAHLDPEQVLAQARAADAAGAPGPLRGVPVGIKDIIDTADLPTAYGSPIYRGHRPGADAACVARIRAAGGVILGKTVTTEFAYRHPFGRTRNPHDRRHTPGGSSSGSAAGVANRMMPLALGTQTGGSVIRPASFCGVFGYKASFGRLALDGVKPLAHSLDTLGLFARDVADLAWLAGVLHGHEVPEPGGARAAPRLRLMRAPAWPQAEPACVEAVERTAARAEQAGARVRDGGPQPALDALAGDHAAIMDFEAFRSLERERLHHASELSEALRAILERAGGVSAARYAMARERAARFRADEETLLDGADALLTASAPGEAPSGLGFTGSHVFNRVWTLLGSPCVTLPAGRGPSGLPIGVQLVGRRGGDTELLGVAAWVAGAVGGC